MSELFNINKKELVSAIVSGLIMSLITMLGIIISLGSIYKVEWLNVLDAGFMAFIVFIVSYLKSLLTDSTGKFIGKIQVK